MQNDFGIAARLELESLSFQLRTDLVVIENLAVENDNNIPVRAE